jgi:hypothetical protein
VRFFVKEACCFSYSFTFASFMFFTSHHLAPTALGEQ